MDNKLPFHNDIYISGNSIVQYSTGKSFSDSPTKVTVKSDTTVGKIISWGDNNNLPNEMNELMKQNGMLKSGLRVLRKSHYGNGMTLIKETATETDNEKTSKRVKTPVSLLDYPDINKFFKRSKLNLFNQEIIGDLETWYIAFPEYILSNDYKTINRVYRQQAGNCRFEEMDKNGYIPRVWVSHKWDEHVDLDSEYAKDIPLINMYWSAEEVKAYCKKNKIRNFCRPVYFPMLLEGVYPFADWHAAKKWIELSNSIPDFKKAMFENQANLSFLIEVSEDYFQRKYKDDWSEKFSPDEQKEIRETFASELDDSITGQANAGVNIHSIMYLDDQGKPESSVKITPIDNKFKEGMYLPEAAAANQEILAALSLDSALIGAGVPGDKSLNSGGNDKRVAWTILQSMMKSNREYSQDIIDFVKEYNKWPEDVSFVFEDTNITTLDKNPTGTQNAINS